MKLSAKGRAALSAMADIANYQQAGPVSIPVIGIRQVMSISYLQVLIEGLRRRRLLRGVRGRHGGYLLARNAALVTVADIILAVDGPRPRARKRGVNNLDPVTEHLWSGLDAFLLDHLATITLQQVVDVYREAPCWGNEQTFIPCELRSSSRAAAILRRLAHSKQDHVAPVRL